MERDKKLEKIIRENSLLSPSENFTESVLNRIITEPVKSSYRPLIGKRAGYIAVSLIVVFVLLAIFSVTNGESKPLVYLPHMDISLPQWNITLPSFKIPSVVLAGVLAVFFLVLSDVGFRRSRP